MAEKLTMTGCRIFAEMAGGARETYYPAFASPLKPGRGLRVVIRSPYKQVYD